jgi:PhzF family phenazine biosynthesis protein
MSRIKFFQIDSFATKQFKGNPAGVCLLKDPLPEQAMRDIAAENNLAETAFLVKKDNGFDLRWFTPTVEVDLCGHATLASAFVLWRQGIVKADEVITFFTRSGELSAVQYGDWIELDFPAYFEEQRELELTAKQALGVDIIESAYAGGRYIVEVGSEEEVRNCRPDFKVLKDFDMIVLTSRGERSGYDFISRSFGPSVGVDEDPVTGSSHCCLATYWSKRLGRDEFIAYQASARGGEVKVKLEGNRVLFSGQAVAYLEGDILLD